MTRADADLILNRVRNGVCDDITWHLITWALVLTGDLSLDSLAD